MLAFGCGEEGDDGIAWPTQPTTTPPPPTTPPVTGTTPTTEATPAPYTLTQQEAMQLAGAGISVAGLRSNGLELLILMSSETVYEQQLVDEEVCGYEYDHVEERDVYECHVESVYEDQPVTKKIWILSGPEIGRLTFPSALAAFARAAALGAVEWRRL